MQSNHCAHENFTLTHLLQYMDIYYNIWAFSDLTFRVLSEPIRKINAFHRRIFIVHKTHFHKSHKSFIKNINFPHGCVLEFKSHNFLILPPI